MVGGSLVALYFIGLDPLLRFVGSAFDPGAAPVIRALTFCLASACIATGLLGLSRLGVAGSGWRKVLGVAGTLISLCGLVSYIVGSVYIYFNPERALRQFFTPGGSALLSPGMLLLAVATLGAGKLRGWRAVTPLLAGLYFPLQLPLRAMFFLRQGRGRLADAAAALREKIGGGHEPADRAFREHYLREVRERLGEAGLEAAVAEGRAMTLERVLDDALRD